MKNKRFDLTLNNWGPYNKEYLGVCHVADPERGVTFNVELFPGFFRRKVLVSHATSDNGLKMWGANAALTRFSYRYELEWKDAVYCDADFVITDDRRCDITCTFVNNTNLPQSVNMNLCASLQYPTVKEGRDIVGYRTIDEAILPEGCEFVDAVDYGRIVCAEVLASDGRYLGEQTFAHATGKGTALSGKHFSSAEHCAAYAAKGDGKVLVRYMASENTEMILLADGKEQTVILPKATAFSTVTSFIPKNCREIMLRPTGKPITLDCLVFGINADQTEFRTAPHHVEATREVKDNRMTLTYEGIPTTYTLTWHEPAQMVRRYYYTDIGRALSLCIHDHVSEVLRAKESIGVYENVMSEPLFLAAGESRALHFTVTSDECQAPAEPPAMYEVATNPDGVAYAFSQNMMAYNTFLNVVYPIYTRRQFIRHNTPGRNWDSLYSWDSGFIGMGLATADFDRAYDCLNTYLTPVGDPHSPYIFHGSVVPTQIFLYQYLFNKYPYQREKLKALYPMVRQFFDFYAKMDERPDQTKSGLLKTWNIFYNSGGWDDYPPQEYLRQAKKRGGEGPSYDNTTPVITSAVTVLIAKILRGISSEMGMEDGADYDRVIAKYSDAILKYAWNEQTGYFSYVTHDTDGHPVGFLKHKDGTDYNQGFDGIYPYIAGITDDGQDARIMANIREGLMTPIGLGVVDTRASYYRTDGYWNGSVWMPHQWILWRALLDCGEGELAFEIAETALKVWKSEVDETYCCFENFMSVNGRGSGFHQFSGLSTPVLMFFESYYTPGTVTTGFETTVLREAWDADKTALTLELKCGGKHPTALICLAAAGDYTFTVNGQQTPARKVTDGAYEIALARGRVTVVATKR